MWILPRNTCMKTACRSIKSKSKLPIGFSLMKTSMGSFFFTFPSSNTYTPWACSPRTPVPARLHSSFPPHKPDSASRIRRGCPPCCFSSPNLPTFSLGVRYSAFYPCPNNGQFQLRKNGAHLDKGLAHGVNLPVAAVHGDAAHNHQPQPLCFDGMDDFA